MVSRFTFFFYFSSVVSCPCGCMEFISVVVTLLESALSALEGSISRLTSLDVKYCFPCRLLLVTFELSRDYVIVGMQFLIMLLFGVRPSLL